jgi:hypothetical protein
VADDPVKEFWFERRVNERRSCPGLRKRIVMGTEKTIGSVERRVSERMVERDGERRGEVKCGNSKGRNARGNKRIRKSPTFVSEGNPFSVFRDGVASKEGSKILQEIARGVKPSKVGG